MISVCQRFGYLWEFSYLCSAEEHLYFLCPADVGMAQTEGSAARRPRPWAPRTTEATHLPTMRGKHYLPTTRAAITARFHSFRALRLSCHETPALLLWNLCFPALKLPLCPDLPPTVFRTWRIVRIFPIPMLCLYVSLMSSMSLVIKSLRIFGLEK